MQENITIEQLNIALRDPDWCVRKSAISNPNATLDQVIN
jgi:hypothetical protein